VKDPSLDCPNKQPRQKRCDCDECIAREVKEYGEPVLEWSERFQRAVEENEKKAGRSPECDGAYELSSGAEVPCGDEGRLCDACSDAEAARWARYFGLKPSTPENREHNRRQLEAFAPAGGES